jgi:formylglycine-generating enzyme required for sulfatase activity
MKSGETVDVKSFYLDKYEVTIADFEQFIIAEKYVTDAEKNGFSICLGYDTVPNVNWKCDSKGKPRSESDYNRPVIHVSYNDVIAYTKWAKKRLPTEEEWVYVALQKHNGRLREKIWYEENSIGKDGYLDVQPVGSKKPNIWDIYDLLGNVIEMTSTRRPEYGNGYIAKGGSYVDYEGSYPTQQIFRQRVLSYDDYSADYMGFRCAQDID